jgi:hypothetical protein
LLLSDLVKEEEELVEYKNSSFFSYLPYVIHVKESFLQKQPAKNL